ncbi:MAG TPA: hypothetical protein VMA74_09905 [Dyella sp.]|uniref:hypothetical protein n=1 Tax=Dyella sp. TaxID=1869338 RepID=UPI002C947530|nr:hypothetical protein [Dyella sp.]HUB90026.1 hypothetical protein [Dyella sp.]
MSDNDFPANGQLIQIEVTVAKQGAGYAWSYALMKAPPGVTVHPGHGTLYIPQDLGSARIDYILNVQASAPSIDMVYANLNVQLPNGVTAQIDSITIHRQDNRVAVQFDNQNQREFGVFLIARDSGNPNQPIISPDPQVTNDPNSEPPTGQ